MNLRLGRYSKVLGTGYHTATFRRICPKFSKILNGARQKLRRPNTLSCSSGMTIALARNYPYNIGGDDVKP